MQFAAFNGQGFRQSFHGNRGFRGKDAERIGRTIGRVKPQKRYSKATKTLHNTVHPERYSRRGWRSRNAYEKLTERSQENAQFWRGRGNRQGKAQANARNKSGLISRKNWPIEPRKLAG